MNVATLASILADAAAYAEELGTELTLTRINSEGVEIIRDMVVAMGVTLPGRVLEYDELIDHARVIRTAQQLYGYIVPVPTALEHTKQYAVIYAA